ncbi:TetR-like C-terminal domain-containing protein [Nonomuraea thailandensis]
MAWLDAAQARAAEIGGRTYRALLGEADDDLLDAIGALIGMASGDLERHVIEPARARGELGPEPLVAEIAAMPVILLRDRIVFGTATATDVAEIVDRICLPLFVVVTTAVRLPPRRNQPLKRRSEEGHPGRVGVPPLPTTPTARTVRSPICWQPWPR